MSNKELKVKSGDLARPAFMDPGSSRGSEGVHRRSRGRYAFQYRHQAALWL